MVIRRPTRSLPQQVRPQRPQLVTPPRAASRKGSLKAQDLRQLPLRLQAVRFQKFLLGVMRRQFQPKEMKVNVPELTCVAYAAALIRGSDPILRRRHLSTQ